MNLQKIILENLDINYREGFSAEKIDENIELVYEQDRVFVYQFN